MNRFEVIQQKLQQFIKKYYTNELIKGAILFFAIGALYFLFTLLFEYFFWLSPWGRALLFWLFVLVEGILFYKFISIPIAKLVQLKKGISHKEAAQIIGNHFPEVNDKLLNVLQLAESKEHSALLLASIHQKSAELQPIPFHIAVNFKKNIKYLNYTFLPLLVIMLIWISGSFKDVSNSYKRVINYQMAYEPPAPFQFFLTNETLHAIENTTFNINLKTIGNVVPEEVYIHIENQTYLMQNKGLSEFEYSISNPKENTDFYFSANQINSKTYRLTLIKVPVLIDFEMLLHYPSYTKKNNEVLKSTGNASVPEGTLITWHLKTKETEKVEWITKDTTLLFYGSGDNFKLSKKIISNFDYQLSTSNKNLLNYENLGFRINAIKDQYPEIEVTYKKDSLANQKMHFSGLISDDYGLTKLQLVYYPKNDEKKQKILPFPLKAGNFSRFTYTFPNEIQLDEGVAYKFYFQLFDNDALRGRKSTKSAVFSYTKLTTSQIEQQQLEQQQETIKNMDNTLQKLDHQEKELKELTKTNKEKERLNFNEKRKLSEFLNRQQQQEQLMQKFTQKLQENLEEFQKDDASKDDFKELLQERLDRQQKELAQQEKLLDELKEITDKIKQEELTKRLEQLAKQQNNTKRSLEQLLELTKRYYVSAKTAKLQQDLERLSKEQEELATKEGKENTKEKQEALNEKFEEFQKEINQLQKENETLKKPMEIGQDENAAQEIKKEQEKATEQLEQMNTKQNEAEQQQSQQKAKQNQKNAAQKMKQMSKEMREQMQAGGQSGAAEDAQMLRQILDNLLVFSFEQESLLLTFDKANNADPNFSKHLRKQHELRELFQHVDDSLFALSLRLPEVSETVNKEISEVYFNIDKALERLAENQTYQAVGNQHYALTATNNLADFLSTVLDNMQQQMASGSGKGNQPDFQLPDVIQTQQQISQQMKDALQHQPQKNIDGKQQQKGDKGKENPSGEDEREAEQRYDIYKQQQQLRQLLEQQLQDKNASGQNKTTKELLKEMEQIENELLEKGLRQNTLQRMLNLEHQLLKMEDAAFQQGRKEERESDTNKQQFENSVTPQYRDAKEYFNQVELLDRQALPLHQIYKRKVKEYFEKEHD